MKEVLYIVATQVKGLGIQVRLANFIIIKGQCNQRKVSKKLVSKRIFWRKNFIVL